FMLTILISASETLGLENVSRTINTFVEYLPNVIAAALIVVLGLLLAHFVRTVVETATEGLGFGYARAVSRLAYIVLIAVVGILAIDQLGVETGLLDRVVEIILVAAGAALAIALGLGTRGVAKSIVSGVYARDLYKSGSKLQFGDYEGTVDSVGSITTSIRTGDGELIHIPNDHLLRKVVRESTS
ncbi:MAG: mechanosensitive ion channel, partial [Gammaproteobacteria bacterium]|nr:mechanosensitive ion channel [Gammaproteobacteria bacterium]